MLRIDLIADVQRLTITLKNGLTCLKGGLCYREPIFCGHGIVIMLRPTEDTQTWEWMLLGIAVWKQEHDRWLGDVQPMLHAQTCKNLAIDRSIHTRITRLKKWTFIYKTN